jgi:hypothetical protein
LGGVGDFLGLFACGVSIAFPFHGAKNFLPGICFRKKTREAAGGQGKGEVAFSATSARLPGSLPPSMPFPSPIRNSPIRTPGGITTSGGALFCGPADFP